MKKISIFFLISMTHVLAQNTLKSDSLHSELLKLRNPSQRHEIYGAFVKNYLYENLDSSAKYADLSFKEAQKSKVSLNLGNAYYHKALVAREKKMYDEAVMYFQAATTYFLKDRKNLELGKCYNNLAHLYKKMGDVQKVELYTIKGLEYAEQAINYFTSAQDTLEIVSAYNTKGIICRDLKQWNEAEEAFNKGISMFKYKPVDSSLGVLNANLGQVYMDHYKNYDAAIAQFQKALGVYLPINYLPGQEHAYRNLSEAYRLKGEYDKAIGFAKKSTGIADQLKDSHRSFNAQQMLSKAYEASGSYQLALEHFKMAKQLEDSTLSLEKSRIVSEMESKYETEKKETEIVTLNERNQRQRNQLIFGGLGLLCLLVLLGVLFFQYKRIKQSREKISEQSEQLKLMMKELHHRVKNNLAIVSSLLKIQSGRMEDAQAIAAVRQGQQRVEAMSLIHQRLYQTDKVTNINIKEYLTDLTESLMQAYGFQPDDFDFKLNIEQEELDVDIAMPLGLILNELITNSFKYAYDNTIRPLLMVNLKNQNGLMLEVQDNGPGIDLKAWEQSKKSFGKKLIYGLSKQIGGELHIENKNGAFYRLTIPKDKLKIAA